MPISDTSCAGAILTIDLGAICDNWRTLATLTGEAECAAVVKANAYGLGALQVAPALYQAGCRHFFVAHLNEGISLRPALPEDATVYILHGLLPGSEPDCLRHRLVPVLNSLPQLHAWRALGRARGRRLPAVLQVDTGMARLGLSEAELREAADVPGALDGIDLRYIMSHLVSAEDRSQTINDQQLTRFRAALSRLPSARASLANSSGIFLGPRFHFDLARPGAALYGVAPVAGQKNPLRPVIQLHGKVIQTRTIEAGATVGYGQNWTARRRSRIATVAVGYADGYLRSLGNRGCLSFAGEQVPLVGNVSMDTITVDVTDLPEDAIHEGTLLELANPVHGVDAIAERAGTIGYEILTSLGERYARRYIGPRVEANAEIIGVNAVPV